MIPNRGYLPDEARGKRVRVILANGMVPNCDATSATTPPGWAADGREGVRWSRTEAPHDIDQWEIAR